MPSSSRLLTRKAASRDSIESRFCALFSSPYRQKNTAKGTITPTARNSRNTQPRVDAPKECTDGTGPPRFINIPYKARAKATFIRTIFHIRNIPRRFCTITEWTKAVRASQGIKAAFSTGSQNQNPPQPRMV